MPALPQQSSCSRGSTSSSPGIAARTARAALRSAERASGGTSPGTRRGAGAARASQEPAPRREAPRRRRRRVEMILQMRAAACRVRDDRGVAVEVALQLPRTRDPLVQAARRAMKCPAAALLPRDVHVVAVGCEHARSRAVDVPEDDALHAAGDDRDARAAAGDPLRRPLVVEPRRSDLPKRRERPGAGSFRNASAARRRRRCGKTAKISQRRSRSSGPRRWCSSTNARVVSIRRSYCTPDGQEDTHAMQPRQRSKCSTTVSVSCSVPSDKPAMS